MINSIYISNFKCFKQLFIPTLGNVNLIIGKNNSGKSSLLEALMIYASGGNEATLRQISIKHGEKYRESMRDELKKSDLNIENNFSTELYPYEHLAYGRSFKTGNIVIGKDVSDSKKIILEPLISNYLDNDETKNNLYKKTFDTYIDKTKGLQEIALEKYRTNTVLNDDLFKNWAQSILKITKGDKVLYINLNMPTTISEQKKFYEFKNLNYNFVGCNQNDISSLGVLWDKITLTSKEPILIESLRLIDENITDLRFVGVNDEREAIIKLNDNTIYPLKSMGDGIIRILDVILNTFAAENGFLLIDELDNGLHYSVQKSLWEIIFKLSKILNIQVFATTHSWDCIQSFSEVACEYNDRNGVLLKIGKSKLSKYKGQPIVTVYEDNKLKYITEQMVEVR